MCMYYLFLILNLLVCTMKGFDHTCAKHTKHFKAELRVRNKASLQPIVPQIAVKVKGNYNRLNKQDIKTGPLKDALKNQVNIVLLWCHSKLFTHRSNLEHMDMIKDKGGLSRIIIKSSKYSNWPWNSDGSHNYHRFCKYYNWRYYFVSF